MSVTTPTAPAPPRPPVRRVRRWLRRRTTWLVGIPVLLVISLVAGTLGYLQYLNANTPAALSFADVPTAVAEAPGSTPGDTTDRAAPSEAATGPSATEPVPEATGPDGAPDGAAAPVGDPVVAPPVGSASDPATQPNPSNQPAPPPGPSATPPPSSQPTSDLDGTWSIGNGSQAGYRMGYSAVGVRGTRVGRGTAVTGTFALAGTTVTSGEFSVDFREVKCDGGSQCDDHVQQMMATDRFPYETFALTRPIELGRIPDDGEQLSATAVGELTLRGVTQPVEFVVTARRNAGRIEVLGTIPVNRDDYKIPDSEEPGFTIDKDGLVEFLLLFDHQG